MIDALVAGKLFGQVQQRTGKTGQPYVTAKIRAADGQGEGQFINVIAFSRTACDALMALGDGDSTAVSGALTVGTWTDNTGNARPSLNLQAHAVLTPYHVTRKRQAVAKDKDTPPQRAPAAAGYLPDDVMPF
ncbi:single-stranded DNA-binding protein [Ottowia beijingensis]|uniref:Single-stranded DNA-binding protein n=1 Tax=Ottowia beijingensis TaxID=1207057 RepID=A0A853IZQ1_9BURK|nr:single-stranded DNA-binding protein [Ottowia beijingensis]NZA00576.1 single-stranded DNA-binding protein [Ottowia beijingensis]NZA03374.1 single-stranded DNA-binding protein [Ottowia beijingensis]